MLLHEFLQDGRVLLLCPQGPLQASDFEDLARIVDPAIASEAGFRGLLIRVAAFPGWADPAALQAHGRFVRDHHRRISKAAVVSDSGLLALLPRLAGLIVQAKLRHFPQAEEAQALQWLLEP